MKKLILIFAIIIIVGGGIWWWQQQATKEEWKTYTNTKYGFEFKYPNDWTLSENSGDNYDLSIVSIADPQHTERNTYNFSIYYYESIADEPENKSNNLNANTIDELIERNKAITKIELTEIDGEQATDVIWGGNYASYVILVSKNSDLYKLYFHNIESKEQLSDIDKQIISTFEFKK